MIRTSHIKSLEIITKKQQSQKQQQQEVPIQPISPSQIPTIIKRNEETSTLINKTRNKQVSRNAQFVYDTVFKRMPDVRWGPGNSIIILEEVKIEEPYTSLAIKPMNGAEDNQYLLETAKKVVDEVWAKIDSERKGG